MTEGDAVAACAQRLGEIVFGGCCGYSRNADSCHYENFWATRMSVVIIRMDRTLISRRIVRRVVGSHRTLELWREFILLVSSLACHGMDFTRYAFGIPAPVLNGAK